MLKWQWQNGTEVPIWHGYVGVFLALSVQLHGNICGLLFRLVLLSIQDCWSGKDGYCPILIIRVSHGEANARCQLYCKENRYKIRAKCDKARFGKFL